MLKQLIFYTDSYIVLTPFRSISGFGVDSDFAWNAAGLIDYRFGFSSNLIQQFRKQ